MRGARLLFPDLRASPDGRFDGEEARIRTCLELGVGGFILFGGVADRVAELTRRLRDESRHPILVGADLERGAGQQFRGLTPLPPLGALGALGDLDAIHEAGRVTAAEARSVGVDWVYAPDADLAVEAANPIVGTRSFGDEPRRVARQVTAWILGCRAGGALACAKHFPGHGRTTVDSHLTLPSVDADLDRLADDLVPFAAAVEAGVPTVMTAHVAFPALDPSGLPATLSAPILQGMLRKGLGFDGLIVSDAMNMAAVAETAGSGADAGVAAVAAGVDALLHPEAPAVLAGALEEALGGALPESRLEDALARLARAGDLAASLPAGDPSGAAAWARDTAWRMVTAVRGRPSGLAGHRVLVRTVDDDLGGPYPPPSRDAFPRALRAAGVEVLGEDADAGARTVLAVYCEPRGWKGRAGLSAASRSAVRETLEREPDALVVLFGHPRLAGAIGGGETVVTAWGGEPLMQEAAAARLAAGVERNPEGSSRV